MDQSSSDLEFFDFKNSSDEEIKEIQAILKGPGSNGCVELPWEIPVSNDSGVGLPETEGVAETVSTFPAKSSEEAVVDSSQNYAHLPTTPQLPPAVETFVTLPTSAVPYQNAPYFVSRTIPYLRAYPPMGMPFFACPLPPPQGEAGPYGQFLPPMNAAEPSEAGGEPTPKTEEPAVPLVPLPPPSTFAVAGYPPGLHTMAPYAGQPTSMYYVPVFNHPYAGGYHLSSPPVPLAPETTDSHKKHGDHENVAMVAEADSLDKTGNHSPPENAVEVSGAGVSGETASTHCEPSEEAASDVRHGDDPPAKTTDSDSSPPSSSEPTGEGSSSPSYLREVPLEPVAPSLCLRETVALNDCHPDLVVCRAPQANVVEDLPKTVPSNDRSPKHVVSTKVDEGLPSNDRPSKPVVCARVDKGLPSNDCPSKPVVRAKVVRDPSRCWADLFKGEVNGIESKRSTLKKDIANGKVTPVNH